MATEEQKKKSLQKRLNPNGTPNQDEDPKSAPSLVFTGFTGSYLLLL
jgi:hypothetical protein